MLAFNLMLNPKMFMRLSHLARRVRAVEAEPLPLRGRGPLCAGHVHAHAAVAVAEHHLQRPVAEIRRPAHLPTTLKQPALFYFALFCGT